MEQEEKIDEVEKRITTIESGDSLKEIEKSYKMIELGKEILEKNRDVISKNRDCEVIVIDEFEITRKAMSEIVPKSKYSRYGIHEITLTKDGNNSKLLIRRNKYLE